MVKMVCKKIYARKITVCSNVLWPLPVHHTISKNEQTPITAIQCMQLKQTDHPISLANKEKIF